METRRVGTDTLLVELSGDWRLEPRLPDLGPVRDALKREPELRRLTFDTTQLTAWSSGLIVFLLKCRDLGREQQLDFDRSSLPAGTLRLMDLAKAAPDVRDTPGASPPGLVIRIGIHMLQLGAAVRDSVSFIGENLLSLARFLRGRRLFRPQEAFWLAQQCGAEALPIVLLIAGLVGMILAFVGAVQLERFGASIYVADMVAIAMVREMGCMMTAIIMCGRTGAAYAAQLGTMKVNQELDAFTVFRVPMMDYLVLPRVLALLAMMPLLTVFADLIGIAGGFVAAMGMLDMSPAAYGQETVAALSLTQFSTGIIKSVVFALIVGLTGCLRGMQCGTNAAAVGQAATSAVVTGITWIIIADAVFAVVFNALAI
jgi:phospholipid/cholesterol/gamma-HCH transport system permease protein